MTTATNDQIEMITYSLTKGTFLSPDGSPCTTYGIRAVQNGETLAAIPDVDPEEAFVLALAERLTAGKAALCHFRDVVEDALGEKD